MAIFAAVLVAIYIVLSPNFLNTVPQELLTTIQVGLVIGIAVALIFSHLAIAFIFLRDEDRTKYRPLLAAQELIQRLSVQPDEHALINTTCTTLEDVLTVRNSGWLWVNPQANDLVLQPACDAGRLEAAPMVFARGNLMLRLLSQRRKPLFQAKLAAEETYRVMAPAEKAWLEGLGMEVYVPVYAGDQLKAILGVGPRRDHHAFTHADLEFLPVAASMTAAMLQAAQVVTDLQTAQAVLTNKIQTLQKTTEEMTTVGSAKNDFITIVSHELKTPVTQVLGFADLLNSMAQDNTLNARTLTDITNDIVKACIRLGEVISQMLEMAQLDVDAVSLNYRETNLEAILKEAIEPYLPAVRDRRLKLTVRGLRQVPPLLADEERLSGAFSQLVSNAIKYTPDGGRIDITARLLPGENNQGAYAEVLIADTGIGIALPQQSLIFEKFYRVGSAALHSTSTTKFMGGGPGLGLPVARGIIEKHGGRVWVESPGHDPEKFPGSRFYIQLPLQPPAFSAAAQTAGSQQAKPEVKKDVTLSPTQNPFIDL